MRSLFFFGLIVPLCALSSLRADVALPAIFGNHMVLQGGIALPVWGTAAPGEKITVSIAGQKAETTAGSNGKWMLKLNPLAITSTPTEMTVAGKNTLTFTDVIVGDVWVCSGQSNMQVGLRAANYGQEEAAKADYPGMRLFKPAQKYAFDPLADCKGEWIVCSPQALQQGRFSAVGFFFGKELYHHLGRPIGLVQVAWGGTAGQLWMSLEALEGNAELKYRADEFKEAKKNSGQGTAEEAGAKELVAKDETVAPKIPTVLFNGLINPLIPYGIKGVIWYQGEANGKSEESSKEYVTLMTELIKDWRSRWGQGDFPFLYVQLEGFDQLPKRPAINGKFYPDLRQAQLKTLSVPKTGMAVALDIGEKNQAHAKNKLDVGRRLALVARHVAYGEDLVYSGPLYKSMAVEGGKVRLSFTNTGGGLVIGSHPPVRVDEEPKPPADHLDGFIIAGSDKNFVPAQAKIDGDTVLVWSDQVPRPTAVRYAWEGFPDNANLYNKEALPAAGFATDK